MTAAAVQGVGAFPSQNVANLIWAYASLGRDPGPALAEAVQRRVVAILTEFTPKVIQSKPAGSQKMLAPRLSTSITYISAVSVF